MSGKRRRSSSRSPSASKKSPKAPAVSTTTLSVWKVLRVLLDIANTSQNNTDGRWSDLLKAWNDPSLTLEMPKRGVPVLDRPVLDAYHCLLASQLLDRLVKQHKKDKTPELLVIVAALADLLSKMLGLDHSSSPSEQAWNNSASRSILSWIVLSSTISSLYVVQTASEVLSEDVRMPMVLDAALATLQRLTVSCNNPSSTSTEVDWMDSSISLETISESYSLEAQETALVLACEEWDEGTTASSAPSSKRSTRRSSSSPKSSRRKDALSLFQSLRGLFGGSKQALIPVLINGTPAAGSDLSRVLASTTLRFHTRGFEPLLEMVYQLAHSDTIDDNVSWTRSERMQLIFRMFCVVTGAGELSRSPPLTVLPATPFLLDFMEFKGRGTPAWQTKDIREWATRAVYQTLQLHQENLLQDPSYVKHIYDEATKEKSDTASAPSLSSLLGSLARVVSFCISGLETSLVKHEVTAKTVFAILWFRQMISHPQIPTMDYSLTQFALQTLVHHFKVLQEVQSCTPNLPRVIEGGSDCAEDLEELFALSESVPVPAAPHAGVMDTGPSMSLSLNDTYAGMWTLRSQFTHEDALSLFLRVVGQEGKSTSSGDTSTWGYNLIDKLCQIATLCCENTNVPISDEEDEEQEETKSTKRKGSRKRPSKGGSKGNKRRKTEKGATVSKASVTGDKNRLAQLKAGALTEALTALVHCLTILERPVSDLAHSIHRGFKLVQGKEVLKLGILVDQTILASHRQSLESGTRFVATDSRVQEGGKNFQDFERALWYSNIRLAQVLGRGQVPFSANLTGVFSDSDRKSLFQSLAGGRKKEWSLQLTPASLSFLVAELTCYPRLGDNNGAEMFLVKACIKSIVHLLSKTDSFTQPDVGIPLGHRDAQVLLLAFSRLSTDKQRKILEDFMHDALEQLTIINENKKMRAILYVHAEASAFIARLVVVISSMRYLFIYGVPLRDVLFSSAGQQEVLLPHSLHQNKWHCQQRTFLGLFQDWKRAALPQLCSLSAGSLFRGEILGHRVKDPKLFEMAFSLGLGTAQRDGSYLMLAAWSELGKLDNEIYLAEISSERLRLHTTTDNVPKRILELRDVLRYIHGSRHEDTGIDTKGAKYLVSALTDAEELFTNILENMDREDLYDDPEKYGPVVVLLGVLPIFVAAIVSHCTKAGNDHFSQSLSRAREISGASGTSAPSGDSGRLERDCWTAFQRLAERCDKLGFAPIHPDWLDVSCRFEMDTADAMECASRASRLLARVIQTSVDQCRKHQIHAMELGGHSSYPYVIHETANYLRSELRSTSASYQEDMVPPDIFSDASMSALSEKVQAARAQWCQDISFGFDQAEPMDSSARFSSATLRAAGEWDVLFTEALAGIGIMSHCPETAAKAPSNTAGPNIPPLQIAAIWRSNLEVACNSLVPVSALLRAAISEKGQRPHPCSFLYCEPDSERVDDYLPSTSSRDTSSITKDTSENLVRALLVCSPFSGGYLFRDCAVAIGNVFPDTAQFSNMQQVYTSHQALFRVNELLQLSESSASNELKRSISVLLEGLVSRIDAVWFKHCLAKGSDLSDSREVETIMGKCSVPDPNKKVFVDPKQAISDLVGLVTDKESIIGNSSRNCLNLLLISLLREVGKIGDEALASFGKLSANVMEKWIRHCLGCDSSSICDSEKSIASTCTLLQLTLQPQVQKKYTQHVHGVLLDMLHNLQFSDHAFGYAVDVLLVASSLTGNLKAVEVELLKACTQGQGTASQAQRVAMLYRFSDFLSREQPCNSGTNVADIVKKTLSDDSRRVKLPISCSFAEKSGYHGQHWYNCYTCGLVWEKGCCTLCALVCHEGHDVSYSRYSSFFCDCGAEPSDSDDHCNPCSCLSPPTPETMKRIEMLESRPHHPGFSLNTTEVSQANVNNGVPAEILMEFIKVSDRGAWRQFLFNQIQEEFTKWNASHSKPELLSKYSTLAANESCAQWIPPTLLQRRMLSRNSKALTVASIPGAPFVRSCSARLTERNIELDGSSESDVRQSNTRSLLVCDSRGRCILGWNNELLFCNIGPHTLTRYDPSAQAETKSREELCVQGVQQVGFDVVGLSLCPTNENLIMYWGRSVVEVAVLDQPWGTLLKTFDASPSAGEQEHIVKSQWIPDSQLFVTATKSLTVHVYDVERNKSAHFEPEMSHSLAGDGSLLDFVLVSCPRNEKVRLFLLVDTGNIMVVDLVLDPTRRFETKEGLPAQTYASTSPLAPVCGFLQIEFLFQSRTLLCTTDSGGIVAFVVDCDGDTRASFELTPNHLLQDLTHGQCPLDSCLFQFWTELGIVYDANVAYFRTACMTRSKHTSKSHLLIVDFNEFQTRIKEIPLDSCCIGTGMRVFSMPCEYRGLEGAMLGERTFLCTTTRTGEVIVYGESYSHAVSPRFSNENSPASWLVSKWTPSIPQSGVPNTPLTGFESLYNISDSDDVLFSSESFDCSALQLKTKLSRDSNSILTCQADKGCTIAISIRPVTTPSKTGSKSSQETTAESVIKHTICGLRILFGSSSKSSPARIMVQGRPIDIVPNSKKWYSILLTDEEITVGLRSGVVTFTIVPEPLSTCEVAVDSIEVYAVGRDDAGVKVKRAFFDRSDRTNGVPRLDDSVLDNVSSGDSRMLSLALKAAGKYCTTAKRSDIALSQLQLLRNLVQATALSADPELTDAVRELVNVSLSDAPQRNVLYMENILRGCLNMLIEVQGTTGKHFLDVSSSPSSWNGLRKVLHDCLRKVVAFACENPMDYLHAVELVSSEGSREPLGVGCSRLIFSALRRCLPCDDLLQSPSGIIDLCLAEIAIKHSTGSGKVLATFDVLRKFLEGETPCNEMTCRAIGDFCERHGRTDVTSSLFSQLQERSLVAYQCDSCGVCPMKVERFTILDDSFDIDLCRSCYNSALRFANENGNGGTPEVLVEIKGSYVGEVTKLTCGQVRRMQSVALETMEVEQMEVESTVSTSQEPSAFQGLQFSVDRFDELKGEPFPESQVYDDFVSFLFSSICKLVTDTLRRGGSDCQSRVLPLTRLLLELIQNSPSEKLKQERAQSFTESLACCLSAALDDSLTEDTVATLSMCIHSMQLLIEGGAQQHSNSKGSNCDKSQSESRRHSPPAIFCQEHNIPAVRRRSSKGANKGRRFYVCGKDRGQRCSFFRWADDVDEPEPENKQHISSFMKSRVHETLWNRNANSSPLHVRLCQAIDILFFKERDTGASGASSSPRRKTVPPKGDGSSFPRQEEELELADGVVCSREKLRGFPLIAVESPTDKATCSRTPIIPPLKKKSIDLLESSLGLLVHVADYKTPGVSRWFSLLCEIETSFGRSWEVRGMTRKALKLLCTKKKTVRHSVRNLLSFGYRLRKLYEYTAPLIAAGVVTVEKCRVCNVDWTSARALDLSSLRTGDLIGVDELLLEGICDRSRFKRIGMVLDDLWNHVRSCEENWRQFCCLASLPVSSRHNESGGRCVGRDECHYIFSNAPAVGLFWLACVLPTVNQQQVLRLLEVGLSRQDGATDNASKMDVDVLAILSTTTFSSMNQVLLANEKHLATHDIASFVVHYVLHGKTADIRQLCHNLCDSLLTSFSSAEKSELLLRLMSSCFGEIGAHGRGSEQFLSLLRVLAKELKPEQVNFVGGEVFDTFVRQLDSIRNGFANGMWFPISSKASGESNQRVLDFSICTFCLKSALATSNSTMTAKSPDRASLLKGRNDDEKQGTAISKIPSKSSRTTRKQNFEALVGPLSRSRLDTLKHSSSSDEFCSYFALKCRLVVSEVYIAVRDPKGRYVKRINLYYSPRPSGDAAELKSDHMSKSWELCTSVVLPKGASRVHVVLPVAVTAANLKVEYSEFYERPGGSKSSTGVMLVHCPRCTRGVASNAIAVCSDKECERALKMLGILNAICQQLEIAIESDIRRIGGTAATTFGIFDEDMGRAIVGYPPKGNTPDNYCDRLDKPGSVVRLVARPELCQSPDRPSGTSDRLRNLIRLARQLRDGTSEAGGRSGDIVIRRHGLSLDGVDDERDLMDLIEGGSLVDSPDRDGRQRLGSRRTADLATKHSNIDDAELRDDIEHCISLHGLLREASTERMLISRRVEAWQRLNNGYLVGKETHGSETVAPMETCHCSNCGVHVATQLLLLWSEIFGASPNNVDIDREMLKILLSEDIGDRVLGSAKKQVAFDIATKSKSGADLVLKELRRILTTRQDSTAAQLLGKILSHDGFPMSLEYSDLAVQVLSTQTT
eukprot:Nitzschia sp. Nitz4//scaffold80_size88189//52173//65261//NITZ4_005091-RA/size88189-snap-gene-0.2-mRNA-1//1//CDS//3329558642//1486//frame0